MHPFFVMLAFLAAALLLPFVLGPVLVRFKLRHQRYARLDEIDFAGIPESSRRFLRHTGEQLNRLGFASVGCFHLANSTPNTDGFVEAWVNERAGDTALASYLINRSSAATIQSAVVEFCTELSDGTEIDTSNSSQPPIYKYPPSKQPFRLPNNQNLSLLYQVHQHRLHRLDKNLERVLPSAGRESFRIVTSMEEDLRMQVFEKLLYLDPKLDAYRPTWKGACLMTWKLVFPIKNILQMRLAKQAARMIKEVQSLSNI